MIKSAYQRHEREVTAQGGKAKEHNVLGENKITGDIGNLYTPKSLIT